LKYIDEEVCKNLGEITSQSRQLINGFIHSIENQNLIGLSSTEIAGLFYLFPENARNRSILRKVIGQPPSWFHRDSTREKPIPTTNQEEALSPTAIVPACIDYRTVYDHPGSLHR